MERKKEIQDTDFHADFHEKLKQKKSEKLINYRELPTVFILPILFQKNPQ